MESTKDDTKFVVMKKIKVVELFAGVGGFRLGLEGWKGKSPSSAYKKEMVSDYEVVFSNQWEPGSSIQHANLVYESKWGGENHCGNDINSFSNNEISKKDTKEMVPEHDLLVGGFPCQDYSVAGVNTKGIQGIKGVLWWNIHRLIEVRRPKYLLLENVDRLLKSPTTQRGRDFAIVLSTLSDLGYDVEWKVINAAEYGMPQRRRRVFIMGTHKSAKIKIKDIKKWVLHDGILAESFPIEVKGEEKSFELLGDPESITNSFAEGKFLNAGMIKGRKVITFDYTPVKDETISYSTYKILGDVLVKPKDVEDEFVVDSQKKLKKPIIKQQRLDSILSYIELNKDSKAILATELDKWKYLKGKKAEERKSSKGIFYYTEGPLKLHDSKKLPSRTIITSEGGPGASRFKHLVEVKKDKHYRRLMPKELERLNMFPDNHTKLEGLSNTKRAFFMGNALVVGIVERIGSVLSERVNN